LEKQENNHYTCITNYNIRMGKDLWPTLTVWRHLHTESGWTLTKIYAVICFSQTCLYCWVTQAHQLQHRAQITTQTKQTKWFFEVTIYQNVWYAEKYLTKKLAG